MESYFHLSILNTVDTAYKIHGHKFNNSMDSKSSGTAWTYSYTLQKIGYLMTYNTQIF